MQIIPAVEIKTSALPEIKTDPFIFFEKSPVWPYIWALKFKDLN